MGPSTLPDSHQTGEAARAGGAAGLPFMLPPGYLFHLNCACSAVGMHRYLADFWKRAKASLIPQPNSLHLRQERENVRKRTVLFSGILCFV